MIITDQRQMARCAWLLTRHLSTLHDILCQIFHEEFIELDCREQQEREEQEMDLPF